MIGRVARTAVAAASLALAVAGCSTGMDSGAGEGRPSPSAVTQTPAAAHTAHAAGAAAAPVARKPLRAGERFVRLAMPKPYTPSAPYGTGTDDYRCFVLDPHLSRDAFITGLDILPGTPSEVHHVILFRAPPETVPAVEGQDAADDGEGWTCFGGTGLERGGALEDAPWLGAWAPGAPSRSWPRTSGSRSRRGRGSSCRCTTTCWRGRVRTCPRLS